MAKKVTRYGMMIALAMVLSYVEVLIPFHMAIPGIKLGLANLVVFVALYLEGTKGAVTISILRILLVGFTFGNGSSLIYSLTGGILSLLVMILAKKLKWFSKIGVSILGGAFHNIGQILVAAYVVQTPQIFYYLPFLLIAGIITGAVIGTVGGMMIKTLRSVGNL